MGVRGIGGVLGRVFARFNEVARSKALYGWVGWLHGILFMPDVHRVRK